MTTSVLRRSVPVALETVAKNTALVVATAGLAVLLVVAAPSRNDPSVLLPAGGLLVGLVLLSTRRYERSLLVVLLYIGLLDGYLKLSTGIDNITLLRDFLLYAVVTGAAVRLLMSRRRTALPPLTWFVVAWIVVVTVQVFNPGSTLSHAVEATRQHVEFVPLFFFGYAIMRTNDRLRALLIAAVFVAAVNGVVNLVQFSLTPEDFARWGPGYSELVLGTGEAPGRSFYDATAGQAFVRPFGLGGDFGFGGIACVLGLAPAIALIILGRRSRLGMIVALPGLALIVIGLVTSQLRTAAIGAFIVVVVFSVLSIVSRKAVVSLLAVAALGLGAYFLVSTFAADNQRSGLARYESITPSKVLDTAAEDRGGSLSEAPGFAVANPLGVGLGTLGPASVRDGGATDTGANSENEFSFLLAEVGIPGLLVLLGFLIWLLVQSVRVVRACVDPSERLMLAALCAPLFFFAVTWFTGTATTGSYTASYFWFVAGVLAWRIARARAYRKSLS